MYFQRKITNDVYHISGNDRRLSRFENMFTLPEGIAYNAYLILDEKTVLIDGIDLSVRDDYNDAVQEILAGRPLDYFIVQHVEPDHCASINDILQLHPNCTLVISAKGLDFMKQFYPDAHNYGVDYDKIAMVVSEGDVIETGNHSLNIVAAPNVHWPEVIMTYDATDKILFSADAFGSFRALEGHIFADQTDYKHVWLDDIRRYYINIVGRQGAAVQRVLVKAAGLEINYICPIHGLVFREAEDIKYIIEKYDIWSSYSVEEEGVCIVYSSMYGNNQLVADTLGYILSAKGVKNIRIHDVSESEISTIISDLFKYSNAIFFAMNYNTELFPKMDALLREIRMLNYDNRKVSYISAMSWGGRGLKIAQDILSTAKNIQEVGTPVTIKSAVTQAQLPELEKFIDEVVASMNA